MSLETRKWKITVEYLDGHIEEQLGEIYLKDAVIEVRTRGAQVGYGDTADLVAWFPLCNIRKSTLEEYFEPEPALHHDTEVLVARHGGNFG
jgi:hypothetical protein